MNEIDVDHNGKLDFSEFVIMMRDKLSGEDMEQEIQQAFRCSRVLLLICHDIASELYLYQLPFE